MNVLINGLGLIVSGQFGNVQPNYGFTGLTFDPINVVTNGFVWGYKDIWYPDTIELSFAGTTWTDAEIQGSTYPIT